MSHAGSPKKKEIYKYEAPWTVYNTSSSVRPDKHFRLAVGSFLEDYVNKVQIITLDEDASQFSVKSIFDHPYPTTKVMFIPDSSGCYADLLATSGDYLRLWKVGTETKLECLLNGNSNTDFCSPLTSFDWNEADPSLLGTSSVDTTCTVWDLETLKPVGKVSGTVRTRLVAHDKEVFDIAFGRSGDGRQVFASVGGDGSLRLFDLRFLDRSTILYEDPDHRALLKVAWNRQDPNYLSTFAVDAKEVIIVDVRVPCTPVTRLKSHRECINGTAWAPQSACHLCTAADDCEVLIWDIHEIPNDIENPILAYTAEAEINQVHWAYGRPDWITISYKNCLEILRV